MARLTLLRTDQTPPDETQRELLRRFLFGFVDGFSKDDKSAWRKFWNRVMGMEPGEIANVEMVFPRSGPFHRRHFAMVNAVFDVQERFESPEQFVNWLKIGAGHIDWVPGAKGGIVPLPKSISYAKADQAQFEQYHRAVVAFLRGEHAAKFLWRHLGDQADEMMNSILEGFDE